MNITLFKCLTCNHKFLRIYFADSCPKCDERFQLTYESIEVDDEFFKHVDKFRNNVRYLSKAYKKEIVND